MKVALLPLALMVTLSTVAPGQPPATGEANGALAGTWEALSRSKGGIGRTLIFDRDGSFVETVGAMPTPARYTLDGTRLVVTDETGAVEEWEISIRGDTLLQRNAEITGTSVRVPTGGGDSGLVGRWNTPFPNTPAGAFVEYSADGLMRLRIPFTIEIGTYSTSGNNLTLRFRGQSPVRMSYDVTGDTLTLRMAGRRADRFRRTR